MIVPLSERKDEKTESFVCTWVRGWQESAAVSGK